MTRGTQPGYKRERKIFVLEFEQYPGLVIRARTVSTGSMITMRGLMSAVDAADPESFIPVYEEFAKHILSWNIDELDDNEEPTGETVPITIEGFLSMDFEFNLDILNAWMTAVSGVTDDLKADSPDGEKLDLAASIPMEVLSRSQVS